MVDDPERPVEALNLLLFPGAHVDYSLYVGRSSKCMRLFDKAGINWETAEQFIDSLVPFIPIIRPRGDT
jgi:hypothetical protein